MVDLKSHEIKTDISGDYTGDFETVGKLSIEETFRTTHVKFKNFFDYEAHLNSIDERYASDVSIFKGYIYILNTSQFKRVKRSQFGNGCGFKHQIIENQGSNCFIPTKGYCFGKCIKQPTGEDYNNYYLDFIRSERRTE